MKAINERLRRQSAKLWRHFARLDGDQRGNVMVLYIASALLLVGMIWAIIGAGQRVVQKEAIQSSADAAAFSAAVIKAKGLNIIAFCNLVMALMLAIIMLLRLIKDALLIVLGICTAACFDIWGGEVLCALAPEVESAYNTYSNLEKQAEDALMQAMRGIAQLERAVTKTFPALSLVEAYRVGTNDVYKKNFGKGTLVTVTWPLPVGDDLSLPTQDGTWKQLCDQATQSIDRLIQIALNGIGLPGVVSGFFGDAVKGLLTPLEGILCDGATGDNTMIDTKEKKYSCGDCQNAEKSTWIGTQVFRKPDGTFDHFVAGQTCHMNGFSSLACSSGSTVFSSCQEGEFKSLTLEECLVSVKKPANLGGDVSGNKPLPLVFTDDWQQHTQVRGFTMLSDANVNPRRTSVNVASKDKGSAPALAMQFGTAQAEWYAFNGPGHDDLWHMDWRARLVRFSFANMQGTDTGNAGGEGVSAAAAQQILQTVQGFLNNSSAASLGDQFMLH